MNTDKNSMPTNPKRMSVDDLRLLRRVARVLAPTWFVAPLFEHIDALQAEIDALQEFKADRTALVLKYEEAQREIASLQQQLDHITRECPGVICSKHTFPKYVQEMTKRIDALGQALEAKDREIDRLACALYLNQKADPKPEPSKAECRAQLREAMQKYEEKEYAPLPEPAPSKADALDEIDIKWLRYLADSPVITDTMDERRLYRTDRANLLRIAGLLEARKPERIEATAAALRRAVRANGKPFYDHEASIRAALEAALNPEGKP